MQFRYHVIASQYPTDHPLSKPREEIIIAADPLLAVEMMREKMIQLFGSDWLGSARYVRVERSGAVSDDSRDVPPSEVKP